MTSELPAEVRCAHDYERVAQRHLDQGTYAYIAGGSAHDRTLSENLRAFERRLLVPRVFGDFADAHTRVTLPGADLAHPFLLAPVAYHGLMHHGAEFEAARAAAATDSCLIASSLSTLAMERIAEAGSTRWFQLYCQPDPEATLRLLRRAEDAGYGAIVVTIDAAIQVPSFSALASGFVMPNDCVPGNFANEASVPRPAPRGSLLQRMAQQSIGLREVEALVAATSLPVWVKGVLHVEDAIRLQALGVAGLVVSNHGGRALDGAIASLDALPAIRAAVGDGFPLLLDGGVRSGADAFKAIALGADSVAIGRLQLYALAVAGALGVAHLLKLLREELEIVMAHTRCPTLAAVRGVELPLRALSSLESSPC